MKRAKAPGEFEYPNDGYTVLAALIEVVSGEPYETFVRSRVFNPARMAGAGFWGAEPEDGIIAPPSDEKQASQTAPTIWRNGRSVSNWGYRGPTGIYATTEDLHRFITSLQAGGILRKETFSQTITSKNPKSGPDSQTYGYGWAIRFEKGRLAEYWHGGNEDWLGHNGMLKSAGDRIYVILTNSGEAGSGSWAHRVEQGLRACEAEPVQ